MPFDRAAVAKAMGTNESAVASGWDLTAHHVLEANIAIGTYDCFFAEFRYAVDGTPLSGPGCGQMLVAGGHPHALDCKAKGTPMRACVDEVPFAEAFDLFVAKSAAPRDGVLDLAAALPSAGDRVYVVGYAAFAWLPADQRQSLASLYPFVSSGKVLRAEGRGIVTNAPAVGGSSGGPMLDAAGKVLGVVSTVVRDERARGTAVPAELPDDASAVAAALDATARQVVAEARAK